MSFDTPPNHADAAEIPFVTFTWSRDVHYAKALLGSIRHFYPDRRIIVVAERDLARCDIAQLRRFPGTDVIPVTDLIRRHKLYLVGLLNKLNVLFLPCVPRAIVADADSILVDMVAEKIDVQTVFTALYGFPAIDGDDAALRSFETWAFPIDEGLKIDPRIRDRALRYVGGSHFYVNTERFPYDLLYESLPRMGYRHGDDSVLKAGDQGFWNLLVNSSRLAADDCAVVPVTVPSDADFAAALDPEWSTLPWITRRAVKEVSFIHYVGAGRKWLRRNHLCPGPLAWGTALYYDAIGRRAYVADEIRRWMAPVLRRAGRLLSTARSPGDA